LHDKLIN